MGTLGCLWYLLEDWDFFSGDCKGMSLFLRVETVYFFFWSCESSFLSTWSKVYEDSRIFMKAPSVSRIVLSNSSLASYFFTSPSLSWFSLSVRAAISLSINCFSSSSLITSSWRSSLLTFMLSMNFDSSLLYLCKVAPWENYRDHLEGGNGSLTYSLIVVLKYFVNC